MMKLATVEAVHPQRGSIDVVLTGTGQRVADVKVMSSSASSDGGDWSVPSVTRPASERAAGGPRTDGSRTMLAVLAPMEGRFVCVGFIHPSGGEVAFTEQDRSIQRHPSGSYITTAPDGSIEVRQNGGAYLRIGTGAHEPLAGRVAGRWNPDRGTPAPITIATDGVTLRLKPGGVLEIEAATEVRITTPTVKLSGDLEAAGDVKAGTVSLRNHRNTGVQTGSGISGPPQA